MEDAHQDCRRVFSSRISQSLRSGSLVKPSTVHDLANVKRLRYTTLDAFVVKVFHRLGHLALALPICRRGDAPLRAVGFRHAVEKSTYSFTRRTTCAAHLDAVENHAFTTASSPAVHATDTRLPSSTAVRSKYSADHHLQASSRLAAATILPFRPLDIARLFTDAGKITLIQQPELP